MEGMNADSYIKQVLPDPKVDFDGVTVMKIGWDKFLSPKEVYALLPAGTLLTIKGGIWQRTRFGVRNFVSGEFLSLHNFAKRHPTAEVCFYNEPPCPELMKLRSVSMDAIYKEFGEEP